MANPKTTAYDYFLRAAESSASSLAIKLVTSPVETAADIERAIESFASAPNGGLLLPPDGATIFHRDLIVELAARHRFPAVYPFHFFVTGGGLGVCKRVRGSRVPDVVRVTKWSGAQLIRDLHSNRRV